VLSSDLEGMLPWLVYGHRGLQKFLPQDTMTDFVENARGGDPPPPPKRVVLAAGATAPNTTSNNTASGKK